MSDKTELLLPPIELIQRDVLHTLAEDIGSGDATAELLPLDLMADAFVITREAAVIAGCAWFETCFTTLDPAVTIQWLAHDGMRVEKNTRLCTIRGKARALVSAERCALNFLQTLSGTATTAAQYVNAVSGTRTTLLDTRKTLPGLRLAQKYAVRCGGASNHRIGLYDAMLIKENHIAAAGSLNAAVRQARAAHPALMLEVEVESLDELDQALLANVDRIMLDEFSADDLREAVKRVAGRVPLEVSGSVDMTRLRAIAETGVDFISIGALTKHLRAIDLSMRIEFQHA